MADKLMTKAVFSKFIDDYYKPALNAKQNTLSFDSTPTAGSTNPATSEGIKEALDGKANSSHAHTIANITGLQTSLNSMQTSLNSMQTSLNSMQTSLDGKADSTHTHSIADVNDLSGKLAKLDGIPEGSGKPAYDSESAALSLPYTALADGWIRIKIQNSMYVPFRICIAGKPVAGVDVTRKADYSDFYEYSVVPIAKGQVLTSTISVGTAINGRLPFECFFCQG